MDAEGFCGTTRLRYYQTARLTWQPGLEVPAWLPASPLACLRSSHASRVSRAWLAFIRRCRILGLSLAEIHELQ
ncbi:MAG: MerR family DNA-binding protein, partial [Dechloromonas sp.]|nr:MerR family DNA-binding protein [Dechloromonas sp.]